MDTAPVGERVELRVEKPVNLRSELSKLSESWAMLAQGGILWQDGKEGDWIEVWVHGFVHKYYVKEMTGR